MALPESQIQIGHCYEAANGQQRRVINIFMHTDGSKRVRYWARGTGTALPWTISGGPLSNPSKLETFATQVIRQIPCDSALPPPGYNLNGLKTGGVMHDLAKATYPYSSGSKVTFNVGGPISTIKDGDGIHDSSHPNDPILVASQVTTVGGQIQMDLTPL